MGVVAGGGGGVAGHWSQCQVTPSPGTVSGEQTDTVLQLLEAAWGYPLHHPAVMDDHDLVLNHIESHGDDWES